jgi:hypothetical protein
MAESPEHSFLSDSFISILKAVSHSKMYAYRESDRKRFDFSCDLARNWKRIVSGQTLWKHTDGLDKDIRILLAELEADVLIYIARDTIRNRSHLREVISDFRLTELRERLSRLRVFWIPEGFDADYEDHRELIYAMLQDSVSTDLLLEIVLGGITKKDVQVLADSGGTVGSNLMTLVEIERSGFMGYTGLGKLLHVSAGVVKDRYTRLSLTGLVDGVAITSKGRVVLDLCGRLYMERHKEGAVDGGLHHICSLLGLDPRRIDLWNERYCGHRLTPNGRHNMEPLFDTSAMLGRQIYDAMQQGMEFPDPHYCLPAD